MNDPEFIELLNLYLDHEITAANAARLEAEVQNNPSRRRVYEQYCRMQKACKMLAVDFQAEPVAAAAGPEKKLVAFGVAANRRNPMRGLLVISTMAAAACVALILIARNRPDAIDGVGASRASIAVQSPQPSTSAISNSPVATEVPRSTQVAATGLVQRPMLVSDPLLLAGKAQIDGKFAVVGTETNDQLAWISALQLAPLQQRVPIEDLRFDARPAPMRPEARPLGGTRAPADAAVELTAFRFTK